METFLSRYRNISILVAILFAQVFGLAVQVRRSPNSESTRLIRVWSVGAVTPFEKAFVWTTDGISNAWHNYVYLRGVRQENRDLKYQLEELRLKQVRLTDDAEQARRLQALLGFKEQYIMKTTAAQVIGVTGSELSRGIYIDKGHSDGIRRDMAVITANGIVGKVLSVYSSTSLVLLINDQTSGVGVMLEKSRLQGVLRGTPSGEVMLEKILSDEQVETGEAVMTSGGDQIFPKGLPAGTVASVAPGPESFLNIRLRPAADLSKLEEVLVITQQVEAPPMAQNATPMRAADVLAQRLPSVPDNQTGDTTPKPGDSEESVPDSPADMTPPDSGKPVPAAAKPPSGAQTASSSSNPKPVKAAAPPAQPTNSPQ